MEGRPKSEFTTHMHPLTNTSTNAGLYKNGWQCDYCDRHNPQAYRWNCMACSFDLCSTCHFSNNVLLLPSTHPHRLSLLPAVCSGVYYRGYDCDKCSVHSKSGYRMNCTACQFDLCMKCFINEANGIDQNLILPIHPHILVKFNSVPFQCNICSKHNNTYSWACMQCNYYLCGCCFILEYEKISISKQTPEHQHPLYFIPSRSVGTYSYGYTCDKCSQHNPTHFKWNCSICSYDLCEKCEIQSNPPPPNALLAEDENNLCVVCQDVRRNATFVHQGTGHTVCCMACATLIQNTKHNCPVCRRKIDAVIQNFFN